MFLWVYPLFLAAALGLAAAYAWLQREAETTYHYSDEDRGCALVFSGIALALSVGVIVIGGILHFVSGKEVILPSTLIAWVFTGICLLTVPFAGFLFVRNIVKLRRVLSRLKRL